MHKCFSLVSVFFLICSFQQIRGVDKNAEDYFSDTFDENKNCKQEDLIKDLLKTSRHERCSVKSRGKKNQFIGILYQGNYIILNI